MGGATLAFSQLVQDIQIECTTLTLPFTSLLPPEAVAGLRVALGKRFERLDQHERATLVTTWVEKTVTHERLMQVVNVHSRDLTLLLEKLVQEGFLHRHGRGRGCFYALETPSQTDSDSYEKPPRDQSLEATSAPLQASPTMQASRPTMQANRPETSLPTLEPSSPTLEPSSPTLEPNSPTLEISSPVLAMSSSPDIVDASIEDELATLWTIAAPVRDAGKVPREVMDETLVELCGHRPLMLNELADLLGRKANGLRDKYLSRLARQGRITMQYPERVSHPRQAYIAVRAEAAAPDETKEGS